MKDDATVEAVAIAMCHALGCVWDWERGPAREEWELQARAAIAAMSGERESVVEEREACAAIADGFAAGPIARL